MQIFHPNRGKIPDEMDSMESAIDLERNMSYNMNDDYFVYSEEIDIRRNTMVVLDVQLNNYYAFQNFHMNLTYPKKIVGSCIDQEHLEGHPNFRYKKVNIIMGANASGKTTFGHMLMNIFNFLARKNFDYVTEGINDRTKDASFILDLASKENIFYRIICTVTPCKNDQYTEDNIKLEIRREKINLKDSYESCAKRIGEAPSQKTESYLEELEKIGELDWLFEYPEDTMRILQFPKNDPKFRAILENILKALDPSIRSVEASRDVENAYVVRLRDKAVILQNGERFTTELLSSGTKAGVEVARVLSSLVQRQYSFYYCDEKFPYVHNDVEKAVLSLMIDYVGPGEQLFFTTHNTSILDMNLPKHAFTFLRKDQDDEDCPITCIDASALLKRNSDSLKNAVENDMFCSAPAVDLIYDIADL